MLYRTREANAAYNSIFDLDTGTWVQEGSEQTDHFVETLADGWYRIGFNGKADGNNGFFCSLVHIRPVIIILFAGNSVRYYLGSHVLLHPAIHVRLITRMYWIKNSWIHDNVCATTTKIPRQPGSPTFRLLLLPAEIRHWLDAELDVYWAVVK